MEMIDHECKVHLSDLIYHRCYGVHTMKLDIWVTRRDENDHEISDWETLNVNYCPYCGLRATEKPIR